MECRARCGACCIAPSISSPIPGMPAGKRAGERCIQLDQEDRCSLFGDPTRPLVCTKFKPEPLVCGRSKDEALILLTRLEEPF